MRRKIIPYDPKLKKLAQYLRNNSTKSEVRLWRYLKGKQMLGYDFHRQKPIDCFICDFYCCELRLAVELDSITHQHEEILLKDRLKEERLKELGVSLLRFSDREVMNNMQNVLQAIRFWIEENTAAASKEYQNQTQAHFSRNP